EQFIREIGNVAPADATRIIAEQIRDLHNSQSVGLLTVGFVGAICSASGGVVSLMDALNGLHHVEDRRPFWKTRGLAVLTTFGASAAILVAALVGVAAGPIAHAIGGAFVMLMWMWSSAMVLLAGALINAVLEDLSRRRTPAKAPASRTGGFATPEQGALPSATEHSHPPLPG